MNVCVISRLLSNGISYARIANDICNMFHEKGDMVTHIGFSIGPMTGYYKYVPYAVHWVPESFRGFPMQEEASKDPLVKYIKQSNIKEPDVVFIIEDISIGGIAMRLKRIWQNTKIVIYTMFDGETMSHILGFAHGIDTIQNVFIGKDGKKTYDKIIVPTMFSHRIFMRNKVMSDVVPLYFDERIFRPSTKIKKPDIFTVVNVARNTDRKNLGNILWALQQFNDGEIVCRFRTELRVHDATSIDIYNLAIKMKLQGKVLFEQFDPMNANNDSELTMSYNDATYGIYPAMREGFCMPALEMMACGTPIIITENTAMDSWVPIEMPRFKADAQLLSSCFSAIEQIVGYRSMVETLKQAKETKFHPDDVRHMVDSFSLSSFKEKIYALVN